MPMIPSFFAVATYSALKIGGYYCFARIANKKLKHNFPPLKFSFLKIASGFLGGFFLFLLLALVRSEQYRSEVIFFLTMFALRYVIWVFVFGYCYRLFQRRSVLMIGSFLGTLLSYFLDLIMWLLFGILPGMEMGFC